MTELAEGGPSAEPPTGYINGNGTHDPKLRRRVAGSNGRSGDRVPTPLTGKLRTAAGGASLLPAATVAAGQLEQYRYALEMAGQVQEIWREGVSALAREGMAQLQEAGEQAMASGQALTAAAPDERADLAWGYMRWTLERMLANSVTVLDLLARPTHQMLDLLAAATEESGTSAAAKRTA